MRYLIDHLRRHRRLDLAVFGALLVALIVVLYLLGPRTALEAEGRARVIDGDSLVVAGVEVRLEGIDAPEGPQTCTRGAKPWPCGREATQRLQTLLGRGDVNCAGTRRDRHDRLLARCRLGETDVNRWMVEQGWAVSYGAFADAERAARHAKRGLWSGTFQPPRDWREENRRAP